MKFLIQGPTKLKGTISVSGDKNTALKIIPATLLTAEKVILKNVPEIQDIYTLLEIMSTLGTTYSFANNVLEIQTANIISTELPEELVKKMRASIMLIGPMLVRAGEIKMGFPGGCVIGKRSIESHLHGFTSLGAKIEESDDFLRIYAPQGLTANFIRMKELSVTATENILIAASGATGKTEIRMGAQEPSVKALGRFLNKIGAKIEGHGSHKINIIGQKDFHTTEDTIIPDRIEAGTFIVGAIASQGDVTIQNLNINHLDALISRLESMEANFEIIDKNTIEVSGAQNLTPITKLDTRTYPGFPTDLQAPMSILFLKANGVSKIFETMFEGRLTYLGELENMGAKVEVLNPQTAIVLGDPNLKLKGRTVNSYDLRAGVTMVLAGIIAEGETEISNIQYIERGYEKLIEKLTGLGVNIKKIEK